MKADSGCNDIISAAKIILLGQLIVGFLFIISICITNNSFGVKSAIIGVAIAVIPSLLGLGSAAYKLKMNTDVSIRYLAKLNSLVKWVYTALMILTVVRFIPVDNKIMLLAYSVTFLGYFLTPILNKPQFRMT